MAAAGVAISKVKKVVKTTLALLLPGFNSSKCKTAAKMAVARIKLLRNKREVVVRQMRSDIAMLLKSGQDATARIRVEHVIREQNVLAANEFIELFCELIVARLTIIAKRRECPADLKEGIASVIFASPRCSEIPELVAITKIFEKKYGKDFVSAAIDLRPNCGVNHMLIDKLSVRTPTGEVKLKVMKEIAKEHQINWDKTESEKELLKPPEELIEGPKTFVSPASLPVQVEQKAPTTRLSNQGENGKKQFEDSASAAGAAAEFAKQAIEAAQAAAFLANKDPNQPSQNPDGFGRKFSSPSIDRGSGTYIQNSSDAFLNQEAKWREDDLERAYRRHSCNETKPANVNEDQYTLRRHSYNKKYNSPPRSDIQFDEADCDEEIDTDERTAKSHPPPARSPPPEPSARSTMDHVPHPKLPDYDDLAARFAALKYQKSQF